MASVAPSEHPSKARNLAVNHGEVTGDVGARRIAARR
jgi:hypothetical protein